MSAKVQKNGVPNPDYVDFINYVFGMNGADRSFYRLLPKLYGENRDPAASTYFVKEDDRIAAAIGAYPLTFSILGEEFKAGGIGNVAVHPRDRSKGYMKDCMAAATADMIADGCDFSVLSGRRHRYAYFGYQKCGNDYQLDISAKNIHYMTGDRLPTLTLHRVGREDGFLLDAIHELHHRRKFCAVRPRADLYDILVSWQAVPYAFLDGDRVAGFAVVGDHGVLDFALDDLSRTADALILLSRVRWGLCYHVPLWDKDLRDALLPYAENCVIGADICFSVFHWERMLSALMKLKAEHTRLVDGSLTVLIHGIAGDERIAVTVKDGVPAVTAHTGDVDAEFSHIEAMDAFFLNATPVRDRLPAAAATWMPLELCICESDNV
ncbi:MAG: GNAT family N-acetyltransferase [Eubacteriales bacterium]